MEAPTLHLAQNNTPCPPPPPPHPCPPPPQNKKLLKVPLFAKFTGPHVVHVIINKYTTLMRMELRISESKDYLDQPYMNHFSNKVWDLEQNMCLTT